MIRSLNLFPRALNRRLAAALAVAVIAGLPLAPTAQAADRPGPVAGGGYWMVSSDGGIFSFGSARFFGSTGNVKLNQPIVGMAATPSGQGYWLVASDGGIFAFGEAGFFGSAGGIILARPITAMAASPSGEGYWFTASDGGVFAFGDARFFGAAAARSGSDSRTVTAMVPSPDGAGYWQASTAGELLAFGSAVDLGGLGQAPNRPIIGMSAAPAVPGSVPAPVGGAGGVGAPSGATNTLPPDTAGPPTSPTATTLPPTPPASGPIRFASAALSSWGTPPDETKPFVNSGGETVYPYSQKVTAIVEIGDRVYIGGEFTDLVGDDRKRTSSAVPLAYLA